MALDCIADLKLTEIKTELRIFSEEKIKHIHFALSVP
jgi:hypothetical protein